MCLERSEQRGTAGGWGSWANQRVWFLFSRTWKATGGILNKNITRQDLCFKKMTGKVEDDMKRERSRHRVTRSGDKRISNGARTMGLRWRAGSGRLVQASKWNRGGNQHGGDGREGSMWFQGFEWGSRRMWIPLLKNEERKESSVLDQRGCRRPRDSQETDLRWESWAAYEDFSITPERWELRRRGIRENQRV